MLRERRTECVTTIAETRDLAARVRDGDGVVPDFETTESAILVEEDMAQRSGWIFRSLGALGALVSLWFALAFLGGLPGSAVEWLALALLGAFAYSLGFTLALFVSHLLGRASRT